MVWGNTPSNSLDRSSLCGGHELLLCHGASLSPSTLYPPTVHATGQNISCFSFFFACVRAFYSCWCALVVLWSTWETFRVPVWITYYLKTMIDFLVCILYAFLFLWLILCGNFLFSLWPSWTQGPCCIYVLPPIMHNGVYGTSRALSKCSLKASWGKILCCANCCQILLKSRQLGCSPERFPESGDTAQCRGACADALCYITTFLAGLEICSAGRWLAGKGVGSVESLIPYHLYPVAPRCLASDGFLVLRGRKLEQVSSLSDEEWLWISFL